MEPKGCRASLHLQERDPCLLSQVIWVWLQMNSCKIPPWFYSIYYYTVLNFLEYLPSLHIPGKQSGRLVLPWAICTMKQSWTVFYCIRTWGVCMEDSCVAWWLLLFFKLLLPGGEHWTELRMGRCNNSSFAASVPFHGVVDLPPFKVVAHNLP